MDNEHAVNYKAHQCKKSRENFNSLSDVLEHDVKKHQDKQVQNNTSFVFSESMLYEFDIWRSQAETVTADELVLVLGRLWDTQAGAYLYLLDQSSLKYMMYLKKYFPEYMAAPIVSGTSNIQVYGTEAASKTYCK